MARKSGRAALALALEQRKTLEELAASRSAPAREVESDDVDQLGSDEVRDKNCGIANEWPVTRKAGQVYTVALRPAKAQISQKGTINEKNGS